MTKTTSKWATVRVWGSSFCLGGLLAVGSIGCSASDGDDEHRGAGGASSGGAGSSTGSTVGVGGSTVSDEPPGIQYFGRWDLSDPDRAVASWGAVYFKARFEGTSVTLRLKDGGNEFEYRIDGGDLTRLSTTVETEYELASGLEDGEHILEVYRRTGGSFGRTEVLGLVLDPGKEILAPPPRAGRLIEVLGDSISVGYGNEGTSTTTRETENGYMAYGPQLARRLDADWSIVAHSGQGLFRNLGQEKAAIESNLQMPDEFLLTFFPSGGDNPAWDFSLFQPDVFIVALGTNDFAWPQWDVDPGPEWEPTEQEFVGAYTEFLSFVRSVYPEAEVFAVGTFMATASNQFGRCNAYVCQAIEEMHDPRMHCVDPGHTSPSGAWLPNGTDYIGDWTHPTVEGHTKIAEKLEAVIRPIVGW